MPKSSLKCFVGYLMVLPENLFELINENRSYLLVGVWQEFWPLDFSESFYFSIVVLLLFESLPRHLSDGLPMPFGLLNIIINTINFNIKMYLFVQH